MPAYAVRFSHEAVTDADALPAHLRPILRDAVQARLINEPAKADRNRKQLEPNSLDDWELRRPPLRIIYDVDEEEQVVTIQAVLLKAGSETSRRGRRIDLRD